MRVPIITEDATRLGRALYFWASMRLATAGGMEDWRSTTPLTRPVSPKTPTHTRPNRKPRPILIEAEPAPALSSFDDRTPTRLIPRVMTKSGIAASASSDIGLEIRGGRLVPVRPTVVPRTTAYRRGSLKISRYGFLVSR